MYRGGIRIERWAKAPGWVIVTMCGRSRGLIVEVVLPVGPLMEQSWGTVLKSRSRASVRLYERSTRCKLVKNTRQYATYFTS